MAQYVEERREAGKRKRMRDDSCCELFDTDFVSDALPASSDVCGEANLSETSSCVIDYLDLCASIEDSDDSVIISPAAKRIREKLFGIFDEVDDSDVQDLDSVIKSFEQEILCASSLCVSETDASSYCETSLQELGYLLEASDDELGLPPSLHSVDERKAIFSDPEVINEYCSDIVSDAVQLDENADGCDFPYAELVHDFRCFQDADDSMVLQSMLGEDVDNSPSDHSVSPSSSVDCLSVFQCL